MRFFFLGERLAVDLLNTVVVQDGRVHLLQGPMDVAAWAEAAGVLPHGAPLERLYGAVARSAAELVAGGDPRRLRKCANPSCRLMFYDVSKAGRRRWCSMRTCGGQAKSRAFYRRRRNGARRGGGSR